MQERFGLSQEQAEGVLGMTLRRLVSLEASKLQEEQRTLQAKWVARSLPRFLLQLRAAGAALGRGGRGNEEMGGGTSVVCIRVLKLQLVSGGGAEQEADPALGAPGTLCRRSTCVSNVSFC